MRTWNMDQCLLKITFILVLVALGEYMECIYVLFVCKYLIVYIIPPSIRPSSSSIRNRVQYHFTHSTLAVHPLTSCPFRFRVSILHKVKLNNNNVHTYFRMLQHFYILHGTYHTTHTTEQHYSKTLQLRRVNLGNSTNNPRGER